MFSFKKKSIDTHTQLAREIILHAHIFKNAGTTIDWILERNFGKRFRDDREDKRMRLEPKYLESVISSKLDLTAISSHSMPLPPRLIDRVNFHIIVMLRHPLLRVRSFYEFERKQEASTLGAINAKKKTFKEYVAWRMCSDVPPTIRNMQVRYLTSNAFPAKKEPSIEHLQKAIEFSEANLLLGIVEKFDQSIIVFSEYFSDAGIDLDFAYRKQNVGARKERNVESELQQLNSDLGDDLYQLLLEQNTLDSRLYEHCEKLITTRVESIDGVQNKLDRLRTESDAL